MQTARVTPFSFGDFSEPAEPQAAKAAPRADADVRAQAYDEGWAAAKASIEAEEAAAIARLADALADERARFAEGLAAQSQAMRETARAFLAEFAGRFTASHEVDLAAALVDRLLAACAERTPARLEVSARSFNALRDKLLAALAERNAGDFVDLAPAADLAPGDCRLVWRGGAATRRLADALARLEEAFAASPAQPGASDEPSLNWRAAPEPSFTDLDAAIARCGAPDSDRHGGNS